MKKMYVMLVIIILSIKVYAENKPIQIALFTPLQIFPEEVAITGVTGLDFGLVNRTTEK